jgi:hypothetical protein
MWTSTVGRTFVKSRNVIIETSGTRVAYDDMKMKFISCTVPNFIFARFALANVIRKDFHGNTISSNTKNDAINNLPQPY